MEMSETESVGDIENDLEIILDGEPGNTELVEENGEQDENRENAEAETRTEVKPKRVIKNPRPKLNEETLKGSRGLAAIESYFERVKFKGRGYEEQDLNVILKTYEYWCHRLFPKFPFDSSIARLETLGTKRATQTQIKKIRMGLNFDVAENAILSEEELTVTDGFVDTYNDQFDQLVTEPTPEISEEQLERIRQNKERAKHLREERLRKLAENTQTLETHNEMDSQYTEQTVSGHSNANVSELHDFDQMETENGGENQIGDEDNIDNILDYINDTHAANSERNAHVFSVTNPTTSANLSHTNDGNNGQIGTQCQSDNSDEYNPQEK